MRTTIVNGGGILAGGRAWSMALACTLALAPSGTTYAETTALDEVVVTAQRLARPAQSIPVSISAVSGEELRDRDVVSARNLATVVPNLSWLATDGASVPSVFIRGVGSPSIHSNQLGAVGLYSDDVTLNSPLLANLALLDLERIEVLRGPRNAGMGRNASGGAVRFISRVPSVGDGPRAEALVRVGSSERLDMELATGFPLGENDAARIALSRESLGDYVKNATLGRDEGSHVRATVRAQWRHQVVGGSRLDIGVHGSQADGESIRYKQIGRGTPGSPGRSDCPFLVVDADPGNGCVDQTGFADSAAFDENFSGHPDRLSATVAGTFMRIERDLPGARLTSLTAYEGGDSRRSEDTDGAPSYLFASWQETDSNQWSQDIQLTSVGDGGTGWQLGLFLLGEDAQYTSVRRNANLVLTPVLLPGTPIPEADVRTSVLYGDLEQRTQHASAWFRGDRTLTSATTLTAEIRIAHEELSGKVRSGVWTDTMPELAPDQFLGKKEVLDFAATSVAVGPGALTQLCPTPLALTRCYTLSPFARSDTLWGGRLALDRRFGRMLLGYVSLARGFKGAGVSPIGRDALVGRGGRTVEPERVLTLELGAKSEWRDRTLRVNGSAFVNEWSDYQLYLSVSTPPAGVGTVLTNLPKAHTWGGELEVEWAPSPAWRLHGGLGLTYSEVRETGDIADSTAGSPLIGVPQLTFEALASRTWNLADGRLTAQLQAAYSDERAFSLNGNASLVEPGYWLVDASARYLFGAKERYEVTLWGRNLGASRYCVRRGLLGGLGSGDAINCQPNEGIPFYGISFFARID